MKSQLIRGGKFGTVWAASIALLLGCSANDNQRTEAATEGDAALSHSVPRAPNYGRGPHRRHGHGYGHGHGHGHGPGVAGSTGVAGSAATGSGGTDSGFPGAGGQSSGVAGGENVAGGPWVGAGGSFTEPSVCGDGIWQRGETCDDGNTSSGDGCSATCFAEPGFVCYPGQACRQPRCGDTYQDSYWIASNGEPVPTGSAGNGSGGAPGGTYYSEACDDGNTVDGDGCSATCTIETGWVCTPGTPCHEMRCGDGYQDSMFLGNNGGASSTGGATGVGTGGAAVTGAGGAISLWVYEQCDDANVTSGDGCSADCTIEPGWICGEPATPCRYPTCGDGIVDWIPGSSNGTGGAGAAGGSSIAMGGSGNQGRMEGCDDGNQQSGDGCSAACETEPGYSCWTGTCKLAVCGDGIVDYPLEDCDDGNNLPNDGCTACQYDGGSWGGGPGASAGFNGVGGSVPLQGGAPGR